MASICRRCGNACKTVKKCDVCGSNMHLFCGQGVGEEGYGQKFDAHCVRKNRIFKLDKKGQGRKRGWVPCKRPN